MLLSLLPACPTEGSISSPFGYRHHPIQNRRKFHRGIDIAAPTGAPVRAAWSGKVIRSRYRTKGYGRYLIIQSGSLRVLYAHLSRRDVKVGETIKAGQIIGAVGESGFATGPHLHLGVQDGHEIMDPSLVMARCQGK